MAEIPANRDPEALARVAELRTAITEIQTSLATLATSTKTSEKMAKEANQIAKLIKAEENRLTGATPFTYKNSNDIAIQINLLRPQVGTAIVEAQQYSALGTLCLRYGVGRPSLKIEPGQLTLSTAATSEITATHVTELQVKLEQALASAQRKHDEYAADIKAELIALLAAYEAVDSTALDDNLKRYYRAYRAELHDLQLNFDRACETVFLQPLQLVEGTIRSSLIKLRQNVLQERPVTPSASKRDVTKRPSKAPAVLVGLTAAGTTASAALLGWMGALNGVEITGGVVVVAVTSALFGRLSRAAAKPTVIRVPAESPTAADQGALGASVARELAAPEPWTKTTLRVLEAQGTIWAAALSQDRADQLNSLLGEARIALTSGAVLAAGELQQEEMRRLLEQHLPQALDSFIKLRMSIPENRVAGDAELSRQLNLIVVDLRRIADLSDEVVLARQQEFGNYLNAALAVSELNLSKPPKVEI